MDGLELGAYEGSTVGVIVGYEVVGPGVGVPGTYDGPAVGSLDGDKVG
jgi:hypothetical protein